jgi:hypothetical protein
MSYHGDTKIFYIDSFNRTSGSPTDFQVNIELPRNDFNRVALLQASIPKSFYNFPKGRNTFYLVELGVETLITIPEGDYGVSSLIANLAPILSASSPNGWTYKMSFPKFLETQTGKITYTVEGNGGSQPSFRFENFCWLQLGFYLNTTYNFVGDTLISVHYISLAPINRLFIKSDMCNTSELSILQEILQTFPDSAMVYYENTNIENNSKPFSTTQSRNFHFTITDRFGIPIETNGLDSVFSIIFYKYDDTSELHKQELMLSNFERMLRLEERSLEKIAGISGDFPHENLGDLHRDLEREFTANPFNPEEQDTKIVPRRSVNN